MESNGMLVKKTDGSLHFCVDYRQLNERTVKDSYPLQRINASLNTLGGSQSFSTFYLRSGYPQFEMHPADAHNIAFLTRKGAFYFK